MKQVMWGFIIISKKMVVMSTRQFNQNLSTELLEYLWRERRCRFAVSISCESGSRGGGPPPRTPNQLCGASEAYRRRHLQVQELQVAAHCVSAMKVVALQVAAMKVAAMKVAAMKVSAMRVSALQVTALQLAAMKAPTLQVGMTNSCSAHQIRHSSAQRNRYFASLGEPGK